MQARKREMDAHKLRELILHISLQSDGDRSFGSVKLNKLLFFADFLAYIKYGHSITGEEYQKLQWGPAPRRMKPVLDEMQNDHEIAIRVTDAYSLPQQRPLALREPNLSPFSPQEIALVDRLISQHWGVSGSRISDESHQFIGWQLASVGETIPYEVALVSTRELTEDEIGVGRKLENVAQQSLTRHGR